MPPRKSNVSVVSNGAEEGVAESPSVKTPKEKEGKSIDDLTLPKSMIARLAKGVLPANTQIQKDALLALHKSATVFVSYIASTSGENAQAAGKKTIMPPDVMAALKDAEFEDFVPRLEAELKRYNDAQCNKRNNYRRKVKEEKAAAAAVVDGDENAQNGSEAMEDSIITANGHANGDRSTLDDADRPMKKFKAENGQAVTPAADDGEDEGDDEGDSEGDEQQEDEEEDEEHEAEEEDGDEGEEDEDEDMEDAGPGVLDPYARDDTLDDNESD